MSGVEFLSIVRRRFPEIGVVAMSGAHSGEHLPEGVMADAFYAKGQPTPAVLFQIVADTIAKCSTDTSRYPRRLAPVWGRRLPGIAPEHGLFWSHVMTAFDPFLFHSMPAQDEASIRHVATFARLNSTTLLICVEWTMITLEPL